MAGQLNPSDSALSPAPSPEAIAAAFNLALAEAEKFVGATAPNPSVGCALLDADGVVLSVAAHQKAGEAHAEAAALAMCRHAGLTDRIHTALVTLEPCSHHGRTPPCVDALLATPVRQVWIGALDPHPRAPGEGVSRLEAADVDTRLIKTLPHAAAGDLARAAARLIAPFALAARLGRPFIVVKTARTARGDMVPPPGRTTFTSEPSLILAHRLRKQADAIVTGSGCVLADNPAFTVRHVPDHPGKKRRLAILDRRRRVPETYLRDARRRGFDVAVHDDLAALPPLLCAGGVLTALVEAGPSLRDAVMTSGLWDLEVLIRQNDDPEGPDIVDYRYREAALA